jgi:hypothetical protein
MFGIPAAPPAVKGRVDIGVTYLADEVRVDDDTLGMNLSICWGAPNTSSVGESFRPSHKR